MVADTVNRSQSNTGKFRVVGAVAHASAASYNTITLAPDSIVAAFGANLATEVRSADSLPLPTELAGTTVTVATARGLPIGAALFRLAESDQLLMPPAVANGVATVTVTNGDGVAVEAPTEISTVAPALFSANPPAKVRRRHWCCVSSITVGGCTNPLRGTTRKHKRLCWCRLI